MLRAKEFARNLRGGVGDQRIQALEQDRTSDLPFALSGFGIANLSQGETGFHIPEAFPTVPTTQFARPYPLPNSLWVAHQERGYWPAPNGGAQTHSLDNS